MDKVVFTGKLFTTFTESKIFPAGFAINISLPVNDVVIFIVDEVFPAVGTLSQMFVPAIRAKVKLPVYFEFFRRSADVTIQYVLGIHSDLHWLVVTTTWRLFAGNRVRLLKFRFRKLLQRPSGRSIHTNRPEKVNESGDKKKTASKKVGGPCEKK